MKEPGVYIVNKIKSNSLVITGNSSDPNWGEAKLIDDFNSPWANIPNVKTEFRALHDTLNFYFSFICFDTSIFIDETYEGNESIGRSDRVELFFRVDSNLNPYYCLEIDPSPRIMDFIARPGKKFDFNWRWPNQAIKVLSNRNENSYSVEGAISLKSLVDFGLVNNNEIEVGLYRAKYIINREGDRYPIWLTWIDPLTKEPNFHITTSFGKMVLATIE